ncbi:MAG: YfcC family protein, partial [Gemmatimonadales bacterium]
MPLLVPLSDLIGLSRQVTVLAYQYGAGLCELLTPTNGALMAMLAASGVRFEEWLGFVVPVVAALATLAAVAIGLAVATGLQ